MVNQALSVSLELWFAAFSLIAAACLLVGKEKKEIGQKALIALQLCNALYLIAESGAWFYDGEAGAGAYWGVKISNFLSFTFEYLMLGATAYYIRARIVEKGKNKPKKIWRIIFSALIVLAEGFLIVSQFTGWFYYVDEANRYVRGDYYMVSQIIGFIIIILLLTRLILAGHSLSLITAHATFLFIVSPMLAMVYQYFHYGFSFVGVATTVSVLLLFITFEIDSAKKIELENKERIKELTYKY